MIVALIGNQNSGKTSLFNALTRSNRKVGNWAGVTVDKKSGVIKNTVHEVIDLPGTYSLIPYSPEEKVTTDYVSAHPDGFYLNVVDSTELERSLYLTLQLVERNVDFMIALNMTDLCEKRGIIIDEKRLSDHIGRAVISLSAKKEMGVNDVIGGLINKKQNKTLPYYTEDFNSADEKTKAQIRYGYIEKICNDCVKKKPLKKDFQKKLDDIFLNKWLAFPIFALIMTAVFSLSVGSIGNLTAEGVESAIAAFNSLIATTLNKLNVADWLKSLVCDGIITGAGSVIAFLPRLIVLYALLSLLDSSGYMARVAFIFDELMKKLNLDGKALVPLIIGAGCSVPAAESAKTIKNRDRKKLVLFLVPFVPCSAKLPLIALFSDFFFHGANGLMVATVYFLAIISIIVSAKFLSVFIKQTAVDDFMTELPSYKLPSLKFVYKDVSDKTVSFIKRAGSVILLSSVIVWFLSSFSLNLTFVSSVKDSILYEAGKYLSFLLYPIISANSPPAFCASLTGLIAKEQIVSTMSVISKAGGSALFLSGEFAFFTPVTALAFVVFNVFCPPCISALATIKKELGSFKLAALAFIYQ
ncbi:MAG: ferrous iron transporter B, partial [Clostridia bacterium]|nr:ferrous iron transporter B [Clostridia bacterium]